MFSLLVTSHMEWRMTIVESAFGGQVPNGGILFIFKRAHGAGHRA